jgi:hypothetical protein
MPHRIKDETVNYAATAVSPTERSAAKHTAQYSYGCVFSNFLPPREKLAVQVLPSFVSRSGKAIVGFQVMLSTLLVAGALLFRKRLEFPPGM